jgi:hypothetical protein
VGACIAAAVEGVWKQAIKLAGAQTIFLHEELAGSHRQTTAQYKCRMYINCFLSCLIVVLHQCLVVSLTVLGDFSGSDIVFHPHIFDVQQKY